ncbi:MAG TPA: hypothetical protein P5228_07215 [Bacteroidales bacterium]|nr:hypothetical protein [Bacteroidales bacterium]HRZ50247.1 hypothetical protein [Bacteroidales bacterium]
MIHLLLALLFSTLIMVTFKIFGKFRIDTLQAITTNYLVAIISGILTAPAGTSVSTLLQAPWLFNAIIIGFFFITVFSVFAVSSLKAGIAITAVSSKMSVVIPVLLGVLVLKNDTLTPVKAAGIVLALIAFYLTFRRKEPFRLKSILVILPVLLFLGNGTNDSLMSYTNVMYGVNENDDTTRLFIVVFSTAFSIGMLITLVRWLVYKVPFQGKNLIAGIILGLFNYLSTYYFYKALGSFPNSVFFPVFNAGIVTLSALTGFLVFREKLRPVNWAGIGASILAIVLIAFADNYSW